MFSSPALETPDLQKIIQIFLTEQRAQRADLADIKRVIHRLANEIRLQKQVDEYFGSENSGEQIASDDS